MLDIELSFQYLLHFVENRKSINTIVIEIQYCEVQGTHSSL